MTTRWGFIGAGYIASRALAPAVHAAHNAILYAVASRDAQRSQSLTPTKIHSSYEDLISDPDVDAIYIALANDQHRRWAIAAMHAGKPVLCEKPMSLNLAESQEMADASKATGKLLVEAVWSRWHPRTIRAVEAIANGEIGDLISIDTAFTYNADLTGNYRLDPTMGGGALLDVGLYELHTWQALTAAPLHLTIDSISRLVGDTGVDLTTEINATLPSGVKLHGLSSFIAPPLQKIYVVGTTGTLEFLDGESFTNWRAPSSLRINEKIEEFAPVDAYQLMVESFSAKLQGKDAWVLPIEDTLRIAATLDQIAAH